MEILFFYRTRQTEKLLQNFDEFFRPSLETKRHQNVFGRKSPFKKNKNTPVKHPGQTDFFTACMVNIVV
jgi:hypothetical protein